MPIPDRSLIRRRLALGAALGLAAFAAMALIVAAVMNRNLDRHPPPLPVEAEQPPPTREPLETPPLPLPPPPLGRGDLIAAVGRAASAYGGSEPAPKADADLIGRNFLIRIPFGCEGPGSTPGAVASWTIDEKRKTVRLRAQPQVWTEATWVAELAGQTPFDAVEGFWVPRPWTSSERCPPAPQAKPEPKPEPAAKKGEVKAETAPAVEPAPPPPPRRTMGLAMFFEPGGSRVVQRGGRPYEFVNKAAGESAPTAPKGYRLTLAGRIVGYADGQAVHCRAEGVYERPVCLMAVAFDEVRFEDGATGETLAEWRMN